MLSRTALRLGALRRSRPLLSKSALLCAASARPALGAYSDAARWTRTETHWGAMAGIAFSSAALASVAVAEEQSNPNVDYDEVRKDIEAAMEIDEDYDDGSFGPVLVRLAWHASGTYSKKERDGGSTGARMRFEPECSWGANAGLGVARGLLEPIKQKHPGISYADLWTLAGVVAVEAMGGPTISWRPGRADEDDGAKSPPDGRLPDAAQGAEHVREIFYRMGFNDQEIVALCGAHALGRCHRDRSGYEGAWTRAPTTFSNEFFRVLLQEDWTKRKWNGPEQFEDKSGDLMMLPADLCFVNDAKFRKWVEIYAGDEERFFRDFARAFQKLLELGVEFPRSSIFYYLFGWLFRLFGF